VFALSPGEKEIRMGVDGMVWHIHHTKDERLETIRVSSLSA
jgi:hypothetical protein